MVWYNLVWLGLVWFDVLAKTPGLYLVPELRYARFGLVWYVFLLWFGMVWYGMVCFGMVWYGLAWFDVLAKTPGLYLVPELRYPWFGLVWYGLVWFCFGMSWFGLV